MEESSVTQVSSVACELDEKIRKTGVVYLSRIPPFMKPQKLKSLLSQYGQIGRIYLVPEDAASAAKRKKYKKNKRKNYVEGWVEFQDKSLAKRVAHMLNNNIIGGKKRSHYHDDIWNLKYLPKFKWHHLTEQLAYEKAVKEQKLRLEVSQARKEASLYLQQAEKAHGLEKMQEKRIAAGKTNSLNNAEMHFRQRKPLLNGKKSDGAKLEDLI